MGSSVIRTMAAALVAVAMASPALAALTYTEDFNSGHANWKQDSAGATNVVPVSTGGPSNDAYVTRNFTLGQYTAPGPQGPAASIIFRGQKNFNSSGQAFVGNWITEKVTEISAYVRHDLGVPMDYTIRLATSGNTPAASYLTSAPAPRGVWTKITFDVTPSSPQNLTYGGGTYATVFSDIANIQLSDVIPAGWAGGVSKTFDLDRVAVVPEPATFGIAGSALAGLAMLIRRRR